jgi:hypothetical protein
MGIKYIGSITHKNTRYRALMTILTWVGVHCPLGENYEGI